MRKNRIVFCNFFGNSYGDNPKYIAEKLLEKNIDCEIIWLLKKNLIGKTVLPDKIKTVQYGSLKALYEMATAAVWVDNTRKAVMPPKRKNQFYIQTWHSPLRLKKIEKDAEKHLSATYMERARIDSLNCDLMLAGNDFSFKTYRNSFWYDGEILKCGTPRCDIFFNDTSGIRKKVYEYFGIKADTGLVLYAPTFRNESGLEAWIPDFNQIIAVAEKKYGGEWRILVRFHPKTDVSSLGLNYGNFIINASGYEDMQELLAAAEMLITDYSSSIFDMLIAGKPCFVHAPDFEKYIERERELYFKPDSLPFCISHDIDGLVRNIMNSDYDEYREKLDNFRKKVNMYENGNASEVLSEIIRERIGQ